MTCNIDSRGKLARLIYGVLVLIGGGWLVYFWALPEGGLVRWAVAIGCGLMGAFGIFEARTGWCVVRAMGIRTPM